MSRPRPPDKRRPEDQADPAAPDPYMPHPNLIPDELHQFLQPLPPRHRSQPLPIPPDTHRDLGAQRRQERQRRRQEASNPHRPPEAPRPAHHHLHQPHEGAPYMPRPTPGQAIDGVNAAPPQPQNPPWGVEGARFPTQPWGGVDSRLTAPHNIQPHHQQQQPHQHRRDQSYTDHRQHDWGTARALPAPLPAPPDAVAPPPRARTPELWNALFSDVFPPRPPHSAQADWPAPAPRHVDLSAPIHAAPSFQLPPTDALPDAEPARQIAAYAAAARRIHDTRNPLQAPLPRPRDERPPPAKRARSEAVIARRPAADAAAAARRDREAGRDGAPRRTNSVDISGHTAAEARSMTAEQRENMLFKRKLRNRVSASNTREKRRATLEALQDQCGELFDAMEELNQRVSEVSKVNRSLRARNAELEGQIGIGVGGAVGRGEAKEGDILPARTGAVDRSSEQTRPDRAREGTVAGGEAGANSGNEDDDDDDDDDDDLDYQYSGGEGDTR